jgi:hypothetical protein
MLTKKLLLTKILIDDFTDLTILMSVTLSLV